LMTQARPVEGSLDEGQEVFCDVFDEIADGAEASWLVAEVDLRDAATGGINAPIAITDGADAVLVGVLALRVGASLLEAAVIANAAAGVVVGKVGTATASVEEVRALLPAATALSPSCRME